jgi:hypothetical protein
MGAERQLGQAGQSPELATTDVPERNAVNKEKHCPMRPEVGGCGEEGPVILFSIFTILS